MFPSLKIRSLRNAEFLQFFSQLQTILQKAFEGTNAPTSFFRLVTALDDLLLEMNPLFGNDNFAALSNEIADLDAERDGYLTGITRLCEAFLYHPAAEKRKAAELLHHHLSLYGTLTELTHQGLAAETASISKLLSQRQNDEAVATAYQLIGAGDWLDALAAANTAFETKYMQRIQAQAAAALPYTLEAKRVETGVVYKQLLEKISSFYTTTEGEEPWLGLVGIINVHIEKYSTLLAQRAGRKRASNAGTAE